MRLQWRDGMQAQAHPAAHPLPTSSAPRAAASPAEAAAPREGSPKLLIVGPEINLAGEITAEVGELEGDEAAQRERAAQRGCPV